MNTLNPRQCLKCERDRWLIERYHYCLKSGCRIEQLQLEDGERIKRALATYAIAKRALLPDGTQCHPTQALLECSLL
ncbi:MAG: hypothetical protein NHB32_15780 [Fischerella sp. CENA71]|nr:hypothetical protein [Fischerella sp. CENA71]